MEDVCQGHPSNLQRRAYETLAPHDVVLQVHEGTGRVGNKQTRVFTTISGGTDDWEQRRLAGLQNRLHLMVGEANESCASAGDV